MITLAPTVKDRAENEDEKADKESDLRALLIGAT